MLGRVPFSRRLGCSTEGRRRRTGGPLLCAAGILVLFDVIDAGGTVQAIATIPQFIWELSLGIYLIVKGVKPSPILTADGRQLAGLPQT